MHEKHSRGLFPESAPSSQSKSLFFGFEPEPEEKAAAPADRCPRCLRVAWSAEGQLGCRSCKDKDGHPFRFGRREALAVSAATFDQQGTLERIGSGGFGVVFRVHPPPEQQSQRPPEMGTVIKVLLPRHEPKPGELPRQYLDYEGNVLLALQAMGSGAPARTVQALEGLIIARGQSESYRKNQLAGFVERPGGLQEPTVPPWPRVVPAAGDAADGPTAVHEKEVNGTRLHYLVLERIPGDPLPKPTTLQDYLDLARRVARAVHQMHEVGLVHGDLKQDNVLCAQTHHGTPGPVVLIDLGAAAVCVPEATPTPARPWIVNDLTPFSAADNQSEPPDESKWKRQGWLDRSWDLYTLGNMLRQLLEEIPRTSTADNEIGQELDDLFEAMTDLDPRGRESRVKALIPGQAQPGADEPTAMAQVWSKLEGLFLRVTTGLSRAVSTYLARFETDEHLRDLARVGLPYVPLAIWERRDADDQEGELEEIKLDKILEGDIAAVLGPPGIGKTTLLLKLWHQGAMALMAARHLQRDPAAPLVPWQPGRQDLPIYLHLAHDVLEHGGVDEALEVQGLKQVVDKETALGYLVLLDALDEVPAAKRRSLLQKVLHWRGRQGSHVRCIISCRSSGFPAGFPPRREDWPHAVRLLLPLEDNDALERFVAGYLPDRSGQASLLALLAGDEHLKRLARFPRFAALLCEEHEKPDSVVEKGVNAVYRRVLDDALTGKPYRSKTRYTTTVVDRDTKKEVLGQLAWRVLEGEKQEDLSRDHLQERLLFDVWELLPKRDRGKVEQTLGTMLDRVAHTAWALIFEELSTAAGLLHQTGDDRYSFPDQSWLGFLAAEHARQHGLLDEVARRGFSLERHVYERKYDDLLHLFAMEQSAPAFLDGLWVRNKPKALEIYNEYSKPAARRDSTIDKLLRLGDHLGESRKPHDVCFDFPAAEKTGSGLPEKQDEQAVFESLLPTPDEGVIREDGNILFLLWCYLRRMARMPAHAAWAKRRERDLFQQELDLLPDRDPRGSPLWVEIPAGTYVVGSKDEDDNPPHEATLQDTAGKLYAYPVTCAEYELLDPYHERERFGERVQDAREPVVDVSWYEALVWCVRNGYGLPTEAMWEVAAAHGKVKRGDRPHAYPWGPEEPDEKRSWYDRLRGEGTSPVRDAGGWPSRPTGAADWEEGKIYELSGNVFEWCQDWYGDIEKDSRLEDPRGPDAGGSRVLRGGSWLDYGHFLRAAYRSNSNPCYRYFHFGFRCSRANVPLDFDPFAL